MAAREFHNVVALQHIFRLPVAQMTLDSGRSSLRGGYDVGLTRPINALMICAAFAFIGALIMGFLP
ncbi:conserved hypothetical protein [Mesorhizobium delmotii]|uniref:Uncharacterized protein n=1 Tax=Mesorhizobium delmotii TaxID=1631247 RepID=A0A2P9AXI7_9HYPH|nr:conserved hypothetical protein [Mesorhizobium delmotii]